MSSMRDWVDVPNFYHVDQLQPCGTDESSNQTSNAGRQQADLPQQPSCQDSTTSSRTFHDAEAGKDCTSDSVGFICHVDESELHAMLQSAMMGRLSPESMTSTDEASILQFGRIRSIPLMNGTHVQQAPLATEVEPEPIPPPPLVDGTNTQHAPHNNGAENSAPAPYDIESQNTAMSDSMHQEMQLARLDVISKRLWVREQRTALRQQREKSNEHDRSLLSVLASLQQPGTFLEAASLTMAIETSILLREQVHEMETDYDEVENGLIRQEWELKEMEKRYYAISTSHRADTVTYNSDVHSETTVTRLRTKSSEAGPVPPRQWLDVLEERLLSRQGDLDITREELDEIEPAIQRVQNVKAYMSAQGRELTSENTELLTHYRARKQDLLESWKQAQRDIFDIEGKIHEHQDVLFRSLMFTDTELAGPYATASAIVEETYELLESPHPLSQPVDTCQASLCMRERLDQAQKLQTFVDRWILPLETPGMGSYLEVTRDDLTDGQNMRRFTNRWLLNIVRKSRIESARYYHWIKDVGAVDVDSIDIKELLQYWERDKADLMVGFEDKGDSLEYDYNLENWGSTHSTGIRSGAVFPYVNPYHDSATASSKRHKPVPDLRFKALQMATSQSGTRSQP